MEQLAVAEKKDEIREALLQGKIVVIKASQSVVRDRRGGKKIHVITINKGGV